MYDVIIIGAGPAGMAAGVECAANNLKTLVIAKDFKLEKDKSEIFDLAFLPKIFEKAVLEKRLETDAKADVAGIERNVVSFSVELSNGKILYCRSVIVSDCNLTFDLLIYESRGNKIKVNVNMETNVAGIFAIGESNNTGEKNVLIAAGEGAKAALAVRNFLKTKGLIFS